MTRDAVAVEQALSSRYSRERRRRSRAATNGSAVRPSSRRAPLDAVEVDLDPGGDRCAAVSSERFMCPPIWRRIRDSSGASRQPARPAVGAAGGSRSCAGRLRSGRRPIARASTSSLRTRPSRAGARRSARGRPRARRRSAARPASGARRRVAHPRPGPVIASGAGRGASGRGPRRGASPRPPRRRRRSARSPSRRRRSHRARRAISATRPARRRRALGVDLVGRDLADRLVGRDRVADRACARRRPCPRRPRAHLGHRTSTSRRSQ